MNLRHKVPLLFLVVLIAACATESPAPPRTVIAPATPPTFVATRNPIFNSTLPPTLISGTPCPITPVQDNRVPDLISVSGEFPIWFAIGTAMLVWTEMSVSSPPFPGRLDKTIVVVSTSEKGDLTITGKQLDGDGVALFTHTAKQRLDKTGQLVNGEFDPEPSQVWIIQAAEKGVMNSPPGYQYHGFLIIYPRPGCYQLTAAFSKYSAHATIEISAN
jgi:hypothetical protein